MDGLSKHLALTHCKLETLLSDADLMAEKQKKYLKPTTSTALVQSSSSTGLGKQTMSSCPICMFKDPSREHVARHFMPEVRSALGVPSANSIFGPHMKYYLPLYYIC